MPPQSKLPAIGEEYVGALPPIGGEWVEPRQPTIAPPPQTPPPGPKPDMVKGEWDPNYSLSEKYRRALGIPHAVYDAGGTHSTVKGLLDTVDSLIQATDFKAKHGLNQIREGNYAKGGREMVQGIGTGALVASAPAIGTALRAAPLATLAKMIGTGAPLAVSHPVIEALSKEAGFTDDQAGLIADAAVTIGGVPVGSKVNKGVNSLTEWAAQRQTTEQIAAARALREKAFPSTASRPHTEADWNEGLSAYQHFNKGTLPTSLEGFEEGLNVTRDGIEASISEAISKFPADTIPTNPWQAAVTALKGSDRADFVKKGMAVLDEQFPQLRGPLTLKQADSLRRTLNSANDATLKANSYNRYNARMNDPGYAAREAALDALKVGVYDQLEARGVTGVADLRKTEGKVLQLRDAAEHFARTGGKEMADTGAPNWLRQALGWTAGKAATATTGSPLASIGGRWLANKALPANLTRDQAFAAAMRLRAASGAEAPFVLPTVPTGIQPRGPLPTTGATTTTPTPFAQAGAPGAQGGQIPPMASHGPVTPQAPPGPLQQAAPGTVNWNAAAPLPPLPLVRSSTGAVVTPPTGPIPMGQMVPTQPAPPLVRSSTGSVVTPPTGPMVQGQSVPVQPAPPVVRSGSGAVVQPPTGPTGSAVGAPVRTGTPFPAPTVPVPPVEVAQQAILASAAKLKIALTPQQGEAALALVRTGHYDADTAVRFVGRPTPSPTPAPVPAPPPQAPNAAGVRTGTAWAPGPAPARPPAEPMPPASVAVREPGRLTEADLTPKEREYFDLAKTFDDPPPPEAVLADIAQARAERAAAPLPTTAAEMEAPATPSRGKKKASAPVSDEGVIVGHEIDPHAPVKNGGYRAIRSTEPGATPAPLLTDARRAMLERMVADFENFPPTPGTLVEGSEQWRYGYDREKYVRGAAGTHVSDDIRVFSGRHGSNGEMRQAIEQLLSGATPSNKLHTAALAAADGYLAGELRPPLTPGNRVRTVADVLGTGEVQPRLPEAGAVRDVDVPTPTMEAPFSLSGGVSERPQGKTSDLFAAPVEPAPSPYPADKAKWGPAQWEQFNKLRAAGLMPEQARRRVNKDMKKD